MTPQGTIQTRIRKEYPHLFKLSVSYTTRTMRQGETNGVEYHFVTVDEFKQVLHFMNYLEDS